MYILKYYYFQKNPDTNRIIGNPIWKQCSGMKLSAVMTAFKAGSENHDLSVYTPRTIYDILDTNEEG